MLVQFVDYGDCEEVNVESLKSLPSVDLVTLPPQVSIIVVKLYFHIWHTVLFLCSTFLPLLL